ncbi:MAG: D-glycerate dehydrogenase [Thermoanaerobaculia bacterium]
MQPTIVVTAQFPPVIREILGGLCDLVEHPTEAARTEEDMITLLSEADGAITLLSDPITRSVLESNRDLKIVANFAVGYNNIDIAAARELGVRVTNTPGVLTEATADLTMALLLATTRRLVEGDREVRSTGRCEWGPLKLLGISLQNKRLGILGMGRIGSAVATRAKAFGMEVQGIRRGDAIKEIIATCDMVSVHVPLTGETENLIDAKFLAMMKPGSYLINAARGAIVDEGALCDALERGHLAGAGLDVYQDEPHVDPRLLALPSVVLLPHIGSATHEARTAMARIAAEEVARFLRGEPARYAVR